MKTEIARYAERFRSAQEEAMSRLAGRYGVDTEEFPPGFLAMLMTSLSRVLTMERSLGMSIGHAETTGLVESFLRRLEGERTPADETS
jgi:hypothetical protein